MTMQRRILIDPRDILALEYECKKCQCRYSLRFDTESKAPWKCPGCDTQWVPTKNNVGRDPVDDVIPRFVEALNLLKAIAKDSTLHLELKIPSEELSSRVPAV